MGQQILRLTATNHLDQEQDILVLADEDYMSAELSALQCSLTFLGVSLLSHLVTRVLQGSEFSVWVPRGLPSDLDLFNTQ